MHQYANQSNKHTCPRIVIRSACSFTGLGRRHLKIIFLKRETKIQDALICMMAIYLEIHIHTHEIIIKASQAKHRQKQRQQRSQIHRETPNQIYHMKLLNSFAILQTLSLIIGAHAEYPGITITDRSYESTLQRSMFSLVNFYREGCFYCDQLEPTYKLLSEVYAPTELQILAVNWKINPRIQSLEGIQGFPEIKLYDNRVRRYVETYKGDRSLDDLIRYLVDRTGVQPVLPEVEHVKVESLEQLERLEKETAVEGKSIFIAFMTPWLEEWGVNFTTYTKMLRQLNPKIKLVVVDCSIGETTEIIRHYRITKFPTFVYKHDLNQDGFKFMDSQEGLNFEVLNAFINNGLGKWFGNIEELVEDRLSRTENKEVTGQGRKYQLSYGKSDGDVEDVDDESELLFKKLREF